MMIAAPTRSERLKAYGASLLATTLFGLSYLFLKVALQTNGGRMFDLLAYRFLVGSLLLLVLQWTGLIRLRFRGKNLKPLALMCLLNPALYFVLEIFGISRVATSEAGMMFTIMPVTTAVLGLIILGERITRRQAFFALLSISGIVLINLYSYVPGSSSNLGRVFLLAAIVTASSYTIVTRRISASFTAVERTAAMIFSGAVFFSTIALAINLKEGTLARFAADFAKPGVLVPVLYLALACSVLAFFLLNYAVNHLPVARMSIMANFSTVVAIIAGVGFLHEPFLWYHGVGSIIILTGVIGTALLGQGRPAATADYATKPRGTTPGISSDGG